MEDFSCYTGTPAACNLKVFVTFVPRSDDFSRRWLPVESLIRGLPQLLSGNCSTNVNENWWFYVVFHHFPSANCHDIAFSLLRRGLISLGGTSFLLGLVYPSWQVKKLRFKRQEMLLSDLSCCQLQEPEAPHCHPCTTPWRMATLKHHRCGLSSFFGSWKFLSKIVVLGGSSFFFTILSSFSSNSLVFSWSSRFFSLPRHWGSEVQQYWDLYSSTQSACVVYSWVSCSKKGQLKMQSMYVWLGWRLISRVF